MSLSVEGLGDKGILSPCSISEQALDYLPCTHAAEACYSLCVHQGVYINLSGSACLCAQGMCMMLQRG